MKITDTSSTLQTGINVHRRLFMMAKDVPGYLSGTAMFSVLLATVIIVQMICLSVIIDRVFIHAKPITHTLYYLLALTIVCRGLLMWFRERLAQQRAVNIKSDFRRQSFKSHLHMGLLYNRSIGTGESVATITEGVEKLDDYFTKYIPSVIHIIILPPVIILFAFSIDWISAVIMLITAPLIIFFMWLIGTYAKQLTHRQWGELSRLSAHFLDVLQGLKTLNIFGANQRESGHVVDASNRFRLITMKVLKVAFMSGMVLELAASISIALVAVQVGIRLIEGLMDYQTGLFILLLAPEFYMPFRSLGAHHHAGMEGAAAAEKLLAITDKQSYNNNAIRTSSLHWEKAGIECRNVGFSYPESNTDALSNIHCRLDPGTMTAIVGQTGSGKTTLAYLLMGFLKPAFGSIIVNNISLDQMDPDAWRSHVAYVPQHPHFFNATVLENLLMACPGADIKAVMQAAEQAGAHHFISRLPQAYHTVLTENASRLSGGEKQRLAIARAFLKDAPFLILDEPSSNLDPESEHDMAEATNRLVQQKTTLIIAHRLQTVRQAHHILVLEKGRIIESGNHSSLIERRGVYHGYLVSLGMKKGGRV